MLRKFVFHIEVKDDIPYGCKHNKTSCHGGEHCFKIVPSIFKKSPRESHNNLDCQFVLGELHYLQNFNHLISCKFIMFQKSF
jgi:hypothetical protein